MILIGLGGNLTSPVHGSPRAVLQAVLADFPNYGLTLEACSSWYRSAPVPASDQPWFINAVAVISGWADPHFLLARLHEIEAQYGRVRGTKWEARILDLDLLAFADKIVDPGTAGSVAGPGAKLVLPHPRLHERAFVLAPLAEIAPVWRHPVLDKTAAQLLAALPESTLPVERLAAVIAGPSTDNGATPGKG